MKLLSIAVNLDGIKTNYSLSTLNRGQAVNIVKQSLLTCSAKQALLNYPELEGSVAFCVETDGKRYILQRKNVARKMVSTLFELVDGKTHQIAAGAEVASKINEIAGIDIATFYNLVVDEQKLLEFGDNFSLNYFSQFRGLAQAEQGGEKTVGSEERAVLTSRKKGILAQLQNLKANKLQIVRREEIDELNKQIEDKQQQLTRLSAQLATNKFQGKSSQVNAKLAVIEGQLQQLAQRKEEISDKSNQLQLYINNTNTSKVDNADTAQLLDKYNEQLTTLEGQAKWYNDEYKSIIEQLEAKQVSREEVVKTNSKIELMLVEKKQSDQLKEENANLNYELGKQNRALEKIEGERLALSNQLREVEESISQMRVNIDGFSTPDSTVGEMLEAARIEVKMNELTAFIDKLNVDLTVKESQLAERENVSVELTSRVRNIVKLDNSVAPIKAKSVILSVLDGKINKTSSILESLKDKQDNYTIQLRELTDKERELQQAVNCIESNVQKAQYEYDQSLNNKFTQLQAAAYTVKKDDIANLGDTIPVMPEIKLEKSEELQRLNELKRQFDERNAEYVEVINEINLLKGSLLELNRFVQVNQTEMQVLTNERNGINRKYQQMLNDNRSDVTQNYIKALESDTSNKYIVDLQQQSISLETEVKELKRSIEQLRARIGEYSSRLKYLNDSYNLLHVDSSVEAYVNNNEVLKAQLQDISERLTSQYNIHKQVMLSLQDVELRSQRTTEQIQETAQAIKVNEQQIMATDLKMQEYNGSDLNELRAATATKIDETQNERAMLSANKSTIEQQIIDNKVEIVKIRWRIEELNTKAAQQRQSIKEATNIIDDETAAEYRRQVDEYDVASNQLKAKYDVLVDLISQANMEADTAQQNNEVAQKFMEVKQDIEELTNRRDLLSDNLVQYAIQQTTFKALVREVETISQIEKGKRKSSPILSAEVFDYVMQVNIRLQQLTNGKFSVVCDRDLTLKNDQTGQNVEFLQLNKQEQLYVYLSFILCLDYNGSDKFVLLGEININNGILSALANLGDVAFVTSVDSRT